MAKKSSKNHKKKKCGAHDKHSVIGGDPCVDERVPDFWERISKIAWLIGLEASITSLGKVKVQQTKEKWGCTTVYYSYKSGCDLVEDRILKTKEKSKYKPHKTPKYIWKAMERQRRLNPNLAHYIYDFSPYECKCKDNFLCKEFSHISTFQKFWDRLITKLLEFYGNLSNRWIMLRWGFVLYGRQWGYSPKQKAKRTLRRPF